MNSPWQQFKTLLRYYTPFLKHKKSEYANGNLDVMSYVIFQVVGSIIFVFLIPLIVICSLIFSNHATEFNSKDAYTVVGVIILVITFFLELALYIYLIKNIKKLRIVNKDKTVNAWAYSTLIPLLVNSLCLLFIAKRRIKK